MTNKQGIKKAGIIATCLATLLLVGSSIAVYAAASRPSPEVSYEVLEDGTMQFQVGTYGVDDTGAISLIVTEDGNKFVGDTVECLPEEWQSQIEANGLVEFRQESWETSNDNGGVFIVTEDGNKFVGDTVECLPEEWQSRIEANGLVEFRQESWEFSNDTGGVFIVTEDGIMIVEDTEALAQMGIYPQP